MLLSILTPTLVERQERFQFLKDKLQRQIQDGSFAERVEHLWVEDHRERSIGYKRNVLLEQARGDFVVFLDDDDDVNDDYVRLICRVIEANPKIDCVGIQGRITFNGSHPHEFVHSVRYRRYFKRHSVYFRPPLHINPIRREIAAMYRFENISYSEDIDWAMRMCRDKILKREILVKEPLYFYDSRRSWRYQQFIDASETARRVLGLQLVNRIRLRRWIRVHISGRSGKMGKE